MFPYFCDNPAPLIIAEIGGNHEGDFAYAQRLLRSAAHSGAHAVKFQSYTADKIVSRVEGERRNAHFKKFELEYQRFVQLAQEARTLGVEFMSSLWDEDAVRALDPYIKIHKVGSGDLTNVRLLKLLAELNKPLILSTAMANLEEVQEAVDFVLRANPRLTEGHRLCVMHCVAMYGAPRDEDANLASISVLQRALPNIPIGYSDHTVGIRACELAFVMGARVLEKHFTDDRTREFRDHHISATDTEIRELARRCDEIILFQGRDEKQPIARVETAERIAEFRRAVYPIVDLKPGDILSEANTTTLRPCKGIDARRYFSVLGKKVRVAKKAFEAIEESELG